MNVCYKSYLKSITSIRYGTGSLNDSESKLIKREWRENNYDLIEWVKLLCGH